MCLKKKPRLELLSRHYECKKCGAVSTEKKKLCKPKKPETTAC